MATGLVFQMIPEWISRRNPVAIGSTNWINVMRTIVGVVFCVIWSAACSSHDQHAEIVPFVCNNPAPSIGQEIYFRVEAVALKKNSLHMDFDGFGADFSSIEARVDDPPQWDGVTISIYYQEEPALNGINLVNGSSFEFKATPPSCLDQPWLFLSDIQVAT